MYNLTIPTKICFFRFEHYLQIIIHRFNSSTKFNNNKKFQIVTQITLIDQIRRRRYRRKALLRDCVVDGRNCFSGKHRRSQIQIRIRFRIKSEKMIGCAITPLNRGSFSLLKSRKRRLKVKN